MYQHIIIIIATIIIIIIIIIIKRHSFECQKVIGDLLCYKIGLLVVLQLLSLLLIMAHVHVFLLICGAMCISSVQRLATISTL